MSTDTLYGVDATVCKPSELPRLCHAYDGVFAKRFNTWHNDTIRLCQYYSGCLPLEYEISKRRFRFLQRLHRDTCSVKIQSFVNAFEGEEMLDTAKIYGLNLTDSKLTVKYKYYDHLKNSLLARGLM